MPVCSNCRTDHAGVPAFMRAVGSERVGEVRIKAPRLRWRWRVDTCGNLGEELRPWHLARAERDEVVRPDLAVHAVHAPAFQLPDEPDERDLRRVGLAREHGLTDERPANRAAVAPPPRSLGWGRALQQPSPDAYTPCLSISPGNWGWERTGGLTTPSPGAHTPCLTPPITPLTGGGGGDDNTLALVLITIVLVFSTMPPKPKHTPNPKKKTNPKAWAYKIWKKSEQDRAKKTRSRANQNADDLKDK